MTEERCALTELHPSSVQDAGPASAAVNGDAQPAASASAPVDSTVQQEAPASATASAEAPSEVPDNPQGAGSSSVSMDVATMLLVSRRQAFLDLPGSPGTYTRFWGRTSARDGMWHCDSFLVTPLNEWRILMTY